MSFRIHPKYQFFILFWKGSDGNDRENDEENDLIILKGCGQRMDYRFPKDLTQCPIYACRKECGIRDNAIDHFRSRHAANSIYCEFCAKPITLKTTLAFVGHYKYVHHVEPPEFLKKQILKEDKVGKSLFENIL